jgi:TorA maturation chaperone TorD
MRTLATMPEVTCSPQEAHELACELLYRFLAMTLADPRWPASHGPLGEVERRALEAAARELFTPHLPSAATGVTLAPTSATPEEAEALQLVDAAAEGIGQADDYYRVFGLVTCHDCPPYETEYQPVTDAFFRAQEMADIAGFYRAFGLAVRRELGERPDHIALELEFMASLLAKQRLARAQTDPAQAAERAAVCADAQKAFFRDHLGWWAGGFAQLVQHKAQHGPLAAVGRLLALLIASERDRLKLPAGQRPVVAMLPAQEPCEECLAGQEALEGDLPLVSAPRAACTGPEITTSRPARPASPHEE